MMRTNFGLDPKKAKMADIADDCAKSVEEIYPYLFIVKNKQNLNLHTDKELHVLYSKAKAETQRYMDKNRDLRKIHRETSRLPNAILELENEMIRLLSTYRLTEIPKDFPSFNIRSQKIAGLMQGSDWHLNEKISMPGVNDFDFDRASRMLHKWTGYSMKKFEWLGIKTVVLGLTGDLLNSDRRVDEKLNQATNRTKATFIAVELLRNIIEDLKMNGFQVYVVYVSGNESRVIEEMGWSEMMMTDNYDYTICKIVEFMYVGDPRVKFIPQQSYVEELVVIAGQNCLFTHGHAKLLQGDVEKGVIQLCGKWSARGIMIHHVFFGHLHYTRNGDHFSRSASLPGANAYSDKALNLITKSAQNTHTIFGNGDIFTERVDLTNIDDIVPYPYNKELEAYNSKSSLKTRSGKTIMEIKAL
jgi:hypothetical protein